MLETNREFGAWQEVEPRHLDIVLLDAEKEIGQ